MKAKLGAHTFFRRFRENILRERLLAPGDRLLVAVSGGPDSVALLLLLRALSPELGLSLTVAHLDHRLRGRASRDDSLWVRAFSARLGIPCVASSSSVAAAARRSRESIETAARSARYEFLSRTAARLKIWKIVLGHHADDLAETVLMRLLRGCGPEGLIGMRPVSARGRRLLIRPLLPFWKGEILSCLRAARVPYRRDATNRDTRFLRNRVRRTLIPYLEREYNPRIREILVHLSGLLRKGASGLFAPAERSALKRVLSASSVGPLNRRHWAALDGLRRKRDGSRVSLPGGATARMEKGRLVIAGREESAAGRRYRYPLAVPGAAMIPEAGVKISARLVRLPRGVAKNAKSFRAYWRRLPPRGERKEYFDPSAAARPLVVRSRLPGDRYRPLGPGGSRKVKAIMIDEKVAPAARDRIPLVADAERVIWLAGHRPSDDCRLREGGRKVLELRVIPLAGGKNARTSRTNKTHKTYKKSGLPRAILFRPPEGRAEKNLEKTQLMD